MDTDCNQRLSYTVEQAMAATGIGRTKIYELIKEGKLASVKIGQRTLIRRVDLEALLRPADRIAA